MQRRRRSLMLAQGCRCTATTLGQATHDMNSTLKGFAARGTLSGLISFNNLDPRVVAALQLRAEISQRLRRTFANTAVVQSKCLRKRWLREKESNLHFRGQNPRCYRLHYPALLVDPTRLKRAPHRLKGGCSVPRAPGQEMAVAEGFEPSMAALTVRCLTNLATPQSGGYGWTRTTNLALIGRLLCVELHSLASRNVDGA